MRPQALTGDEEFVVGHQDDGASSIC